MAERDNPFIGTIDSSYIKPLINNETLFDIPSSSGPQVVQPPPNPEASGWNSFLSRISGGSTIGDNGPSVWQNIFGGRYDDGTSLQGVAGPVGNLIGGAFNTYNAFKNRDLMQKNYDLAVKEGNRNFNAQANTINSALESQAMAREGSTRDPALKQKFRDQFEKYKIQ